MTDFPCKTTDIAGKMNGPGGATNAIPGPNRNRSQEDQVMADDSQYRDSAPAIKPIETAYRGYRFRSRLEARWAVFFDGIKLDWRYEPQGFEKNGDRYLPDFLVFIQGRPVWVEVKGQPNWLIENNDRLSRWFSGEPIVPGGRMLLLGEVPQAARGALLLRALTCSDGVFAAGWMDIAADNGGDVELAAWPRQALQYFADEDRLAGFQPFIVPATAYCPPIYHALSDARSARFEHGARGAI